MTDQPTEGTVTIHCRYCGAPHEFALDSPEANGVFNVYCANKDCEDEHAWFERPKLPPTETTR